MVPWHFLSEFLENKRFTGWFSSSVRSFFFFFQKSCSVTSPGDRHITWKTFMKLLIDFFLRGKMFRTHFHALFNSKHYAEVRKKRTFFSSHPSCGHHRPRSLREHSWTFLLLLYSEFSGPAACPPSSSVIHLTPQWRLDRCRKVVSFPYSPKYT